MRTQFEYELEDELEAEAEFEQMMRVSDASISQQLGRRPVAREGAAASFSNYDVIDSRIDVAAQRSLIRMRGNPATSANAAAILAAVKGGRLAGIYGDDLLAAAQLASRLNTVRWELVPRGRDSAMVREPNPAARPTLIFRAHIRDDHPRVDRALLSAWTDFDTTSAIPIPHPHLGIVWSVPRTVMAQREAEFFESPRPARRQAQRGSYRDEGEAQVALPPPVRTIVPDTTIAPLRWICSLEIDYGPDPDSSTRVLTSNGSGVLISPIHVLTAGHCLVSFSQVGSAGTTVPKRPASTVAIVPARNFVATRRAPFGVFPAMTRRVSNGWDQFIAPGFDFGLITLNRPVAGMSYWSSPASTAGRRGIIRGMALTDLIGGPVFTSGYPADKCGPLPPAGSATVAAMTTCRNGDILTGVDAKRSASTQWGSNGIVRNSSDSERMLDIFGMGAVRGQSGSPIWIGPPESPNLVAILATGSSGVGDVLGAMNQGVHLSREVIEQLRRWIRADGIAPSF